MSHSYQAGNKTKEKIINAAGQLAAEIGLVNVTIGKLAKFCGENKGTIHYHFKGRDNLLEAIMREIISKWDRKKPYQEILDLLEESSANKNNQAKAIDMAVRWQIEKLFADDEPDWHRRVLYQGLDLKGKLADIVIGEVFKPHTELLQHIFKKVDPSLTPEESFIHAITISSSIFIQAKEEESFAGMFDRKSHSKSYIDNLAKISVLRICKTFDLPVLEL